MGETSTAPDVPAWLVLVKHRFAFLEIADFGWVNDEQLTVDAKVLANTGSNRKRRKVNTAVAAINNSNHPTVRATAPVHDRVMTSEIWTSFRTLAQHSSEQASLGMTCQINRGASASELCANGMILKTWTRVLLGKRVTNQDGCHTKNEDASESYMSHLKTTTAATKPSRGDESQPHKPE